MSKQAEKHWFPLESNPALVNKYILNLGFNTENYEFVDVFSTESWALALVPSPVLAVVMLYPITERQESHRNKEIEGKNSSENVWFVKQRIRNACGTFGIVHALANIPQSLKEAYFVPNGWINTFLKKAPASLSPIEKAELFENDTEIEKMHDIATSDELNSTNRGEDIQQKVEPHFAALVHVDGGLYELDGRKEGPVRHGDTSQENLLTDACAVVKQFMERDPDEMRFNILALAPKIN